MPFLAPPHLPYMAWGPFLSRLRERTIILLTLFLPYAKHLPLPLIGVLLMTVSSGGVEGRPAGVA